MWITCCVAGMDDYLPMAAEVLARGARAVCAERRVEGRWLRSR